MNSLHHVYSNERFDQTTFLCNIEYFYARLLKYRTDYRQYERKDPKTVIVHQLSSIPWNAA